MLILFSTTGILMGEVVFIEIMEKPLLHNKPPGFYKIIAI